MLTPHDIAYIAVRRRPARSGRASGRGGGTRSSTRSTCARSRTPTATGSATSRACAGTLDHIAGLGADRHLDQPLLPLAAGRPRLRRRRLLRHRAGVRRPGRRSTGCSPTRTRAACSVLMDIVPNHCSSRARLVPGGAGGRARVAGAGPVHLPRRARVRTAREPPNNWRSVFGGPAWTRVTEADGSPGQWYLHLFDPSQPDFDWRNPEVGDMFEQVLRFWFDRGVDGFRIDVAHGLVKAAELPEWDLPPHAAGEPGHPSPMWDQPEVHDVYRRWRRIAESYAGRGHHLRRRDLGARPGGAGAVPAPRRAAAGVPLRPADPAVAAPTTCARRCSAGWTTSAATGATVTWTLANHDVHRAVTRYGRDQDLVVDRPGRPGRQHPPAGERRSTSPRAAGSPGRPRS